MELITPTGGLRRHLRALFRRRRLWAEFRRNLEREPCALLVFRTRWRRRFHGRLTTSRMDALGVEPARPADASVLARVMSEYPDAVILFCNVLGQMRFVLDDADERADFARDGKPPATIDELFPDGGELLDHLTDDVIPRPRRRAWLRWRFDGSSWHLVEVASGSR